MRTRFLIGGWITIGCAALCTACGSTAPPSMVERMPPAIQRYAEESQLRDPVDRNSPIPLERLVIRATIESQERFEAGPPFDAYVPHEPFSWLVTLHVEEVLDGSYDDEKIRIVIRSPFEQFAFPFSEHREFRLTLMPNARADEHILVDIHPRGAELARQAKRIRAAEIAEDEADDEPETGDQRPE